MIARGIHRLFNPSSYFNIPTGLEASDSYNGVLMVSTKLSQLIGLSLNTRAIFIRMILKQNSLVRALGISFIPKILFLLKAIVSLSKTHKSLQTWLLYYSLVISLITYGMIVFKSWISFAVGCLLLFTECVACFLKSDTIAHENFEGLGISSNLSNIIKEYSIVTAGMLLTIIFINYEKRREIK